MRRGRNVNGKRQTFHMREEEYLDLKGFLDYFLFENLLTTFLKNDFAGYASKN